jgi:hypothetical protein
MRLFLLIIAASSLSGCALQFETKRGTKVSLGFNPSPDQIESFRK